VRVATTETSHRRQALAAVDIVRVAGRIVRRHARMTVVRAAVHARMSAIHGGGVGLGCGVVGGR
jgi:hypothetical protein